MTHHAAVEVRDRVSSVAGGHHAVTPHLKGTGASAAFANPGAGATENEKPAGATTSVVPTGAPTAFDPIIGASQVRSAHNINGTGMTVAVIDTGVDYNNTALGGGFGPGAKVIAGYDFADNAANPMATSSQHGTAVAGLIGSDDSNDLGVAPGVNIVALRVTDDTNTGSLTSIANALQWVIDHHDQYKITAVNISLSDGNNYAQNWFANGGGVAQQITDLIGQLKTLNIPVVAATGNNFNGQQGEGFASIVSDTISVTATDFSDHLLPNAQRLGAAIGGGSATTLAAPGEGLTAPSGDSGSATVEGTSFAAPLVTGAVVLLQQIYESRFDTLPTVDELKSWLQQGSDPVHDPVTGITIGRLDIPKAASLIPSAPAPALPQVSPVITTPVTPAPVVPAAVVSPAPSAPATTTSASVSSTAQAASNVSSSHAGASNSSGTQPLSGTSAVEDLWNSMSIWAASNASDAWTSAFTQVQVWNAS
jgi:type VI secretion system secreted protein VgrG